MIKKQKDDIRAEYREKRRTMNPEERFARDTAICNAAIGLVSFRYAEYVLLYAPTQEEIDVMTYKMKNTDIDAVLGDLVVQRTLGFLLKGQIKKTVADMNKKLQNLSCQYGIHEGTGRVTIKMVDKETKDVIKEFPAEETLELIAKAWELAGIMVDKRL